MVASSVAVAATAEFDGVTPLDPGAFHTSAWVLVVADRAATKREPVAALASIAAGQALAAVLADTVAGRQSVADSAAGLAHRIAGFERSPAAAAAGSVARQERDTRMVEIVAAAVPARVLEGMATAAVLALPATVPLAVATAASGAVTFPAVARIHALVPHWEIAAPAVILAVVVLLAAGMVAMVTAWSLVSYVHNRRFL